jgi:hypothetical protein
MNVTRRSAAALLGALPFAGRAIAGGALQKQSIGVGGQLAGGSRAWKFANDAVGQEKVSGPLVPQWRAAQLALSDPDVRALARSVAFSQHRFIGLVDPDIEVYRSFSPMAKITFQRQRNVDREINGMCSAPEYERASLLEQIIGKFMWGR